MCVLAIIFICCLDNTCITWFLLITLLFYLCVWFFLLLCNCVCVCCNLVLGFDVQVMDAPGLEDDFYSNLLDWSSMNILAVGLGNCVYIKNVCTSKVRF